MSKIIQVLFSLILLFSSAVNSATVVRMKTVLGDIDVELYPDVAPKTVANFLNYVLDGDFDNSFIHRSIPDFVIQGGVFALNGDDVVEIPQNAPVENEFNLSNARGTIAMAKLSGDPDSATNSWFFNLSDNNTGTANQGNLDLQNEGFTVFGEIINGLDIMDAIGNLPVGPFGTSFSSVPIVDGGSSVDEASDLVLLDMELIESDLNLNSGLNGFWFNSQTSGQGVGIEILPTNGIAFMAWFTHDTQTAPQDTPSQIGDANNRWMSGTGTLDFETNSITFDLTTTSGGLFDTGTEVTNSDPGSVGSAVLSFEDCSNASITYTLSNPDLSNTFSLGRIASDNVNLCEKLSAEAFINID